MLIPGRQCGLITACYSEILPIDFFNNDCLLKRLFYNRAHTFFRGIGDITVLLKPWV
jgi:hypothetical protein